GGELAEGKLDLLERLKLRQHPPDGIHGHRDRFVEPLQLLMNLLLLNLLLDWHGDISFPPYGDVRGFDQGVQSRPGATQLRPWLLHLYPGESVVRRPRR